MENSIRWKYYFYDAQIYENKANINLEPKHRIFTVSHLCPHLYKNSPHISDVVT